MAYLFGHRIGGLLVQLLLLSIPELKTIFMTDISKHSNESGPQRNF